MANGKIQPVLQVKISAEVSGEIIDLPVKEGQKVNKGDLLVKIKPEFYIAAVNQANASYQVRAGGQGHGRGQPAKGRSRLSSATRTCSEHKLVSDSDFDEVQAAYDVAKAQLESAAAPGRSRQSRRWTAPRTRWTRRPSWRRSTGDHQQAQFPPGRARAGHGPERRHRDHDHRRPQRNGGAGGHRRERRGADRAGAKGAAGGGRLQEPQVQRHGHRDRQLVQRRRAGEHGHQPGGHQVRGANPHPGKGSLPARHVRDGRDRNLLPHQRAHRAVRQRHHPAAEGKGEEGRRQARRPG